MARLSGKAGAASVGSLTSLILTGWEYEETSSNIEATAAGDLFTERIHLRSDWRATVRALLSATPPYAMVAIPVGQEVSMSLKVLAADSNPLITDTGLCVSGRIVHEHDGATTLEMELQSSDGSAGPTVDTTPAT